MNVYDFDKTIYKKDSSVQLYLFVIKKNPLILFRCLYKQIWAILSYKVKKIDKEEMKSKYFCFLKYLDIEKLVDEFVKKEIRNINNWYLIKRKDDDVIISASPEFLVKAFMKELGISSVIASNVDSQTGRYDGKNCYGQEKVKRFQEIYGDFEIEEFYTDSKSDLPMAEKARKAYMVKGEKISMFFEK